MAQLKSHKGHSRGHCMVTVWSLYGHCMVTVWSLYGHYMVTVWSLYGHWATCGPCATQQGPSRLMRLPGTLGGFGRPNNSLEAYLER